MVHIPSVVHEPMPMCYQGQGRQLLSSFLPFTDATDEPPISHAGRWSELLLRGRSYKQEVGGQITGEIQKLEMPDNVKL